jgi:raffinose/stachyose/melibiose transport system substrate-binding protein
MKKVLAIALALCMVFTLVPAAFAADLPTDEDITLTMWCIATESDANRPAYEKAVAEF